MSHISGFSLDIYLAMPKRSVAAAPNTNLELSIIVIKLSIIVLNEIPIFLNIFAASEAQRIFVSKNTVYESHVPLVVHELTLWFGPIVPAVQKESLFPLGCV